MGEYPVSEVATVFTLFKMTTPPSQNRHAKCNCVQHIAFGEHMHQITDHNGCSISQVWSPQRDLRKSQKDYKVCSHFTLWLLWCHHLIIL